MVECENLKDGNCGVASQLTREQSRRVLRWNPADPVPGKLYRNQRIRACPGGLWVVHADLFNRHRMDERFEGWGCEDTEFLRRIPWRRLPGPLFPIWHAKASKERFEQNRRILKVALRADQGRFIFPHCCGYR